MKISTSKHIRNFK